MAHLNNSLATGKLSRTHVNKPVVRGLKGKTGVAKPSKRRKGKSTSRQAETREKFLFAARYARAIIRNPDKGMAEAYASALRPRQNIYSRALEDFMSSPVVKCIDTGNYKGTVGDTIAVRAMDDFRVVRVIVEVYGANGKLLEAGNAELNANGIDYTYTVIQANSTLEGCKIIAIAIDIPGNEGTLEVSL